MKLEQVKKQTALGKLLYWIKERHSIYMKRLEGKPKPWTDDPILQNYFFCNPYRENDKVTTWLRENIRNRYANQPEILFATIAFRWFNYIPTGELLLNYGQDQEGVANLFEKWNLKLVKNLLGYARDSGNQVFTGAFNISNSGSTKPKIDRVCDDYIQPVWDCKGDLEVAVEGRSLQEAFKAINKLPGLGGSGFMAAQVVCDLKYTYLLKDAQDWWTWCSPGPGSKRGMNRLHSLPIDTLIKPAEWNQKITELQETVHKRLFNLPKLHAQDLQNCLCEYDKYCRALEGDGHMKRRYQGTNNA